MLEQSLFSKEPSLPYPPNTKKPRETKRTMGDSKCILSEWLSLMKIVWGILVAFIVWTPKKNPKFTRKGNKFETWSILEGSLQLTKVYVAGKWFYRTSTCDNMQNMHRQGWWTLNEKHVASALKKGNPKEDIKH
jgi:hypothetical protein